MELFRDSYSSNSLKYSTNYPETFHSDYVSITLFYDHVLDYFDDIILLVFIVFAFILLLFALFQIFAFHFIRRRTTSGGGGRVVVVIGRNWDKKGDA